MVLFPVGVVKQVWSCEAEGFGWLLVCLFQTFKKRVLVICDALPKLMMVHRNKHDNNSTMSLS